MAGPALVARNKTTGEIVGSVDPPGGPHRNADDLHARRKAVLRYYDRRRRPGAGRGWRYLDQFGQMTIRPPRSKTHIWVIHNPRGGWPIGDDTIGEIEAAGKQPAPPVVEYDVEGNVVQGWGGHGPGSSWPQVSDAAIHTECERNTRSSSTIRTTSGSPGMDMWPSSSPPAGDRRA